MQMREHELYIVQNYLSQSESTSLTFLKLVYLAILKPSWYCEDIYCLNARHGLKH